MGYKLLTLGPGSREVSHFFQVKDIHFSLISTHLFQTNSIQLFIIFQNIN